MVKTKIQLIKRQISYVFVAAVTVFAYFPSVVSAAQITSRSVVLGSSIASADTTYNFTFTAAQSTTIKSVSFAGCTTASGACTPATGFMDPNDSTLSSTSNLGSGGTWIVNTGTVGELRMSNTSNTGSPSAGITANFSNVENPSTTGTFYMRITTFSDDSFTTPIDTGTIAVSTADGVTVTANVNEALTFTVGSTTVAMGTLSTITEGSGISTLSAATNAAGGYTIKYSGTTLTSGASTIDALTSGGTTSNGTEQFGINLMDNTDPNVGSAATGTGSVLSGYNTIDNFKFVTTGENIAQNNAPTSGDAYTVSYMANINAATAPGNYTANINYVITANF